MVKGSVKRVLGLLFGAGLVLGCLFPIAAEGSLTMDYQVLNTVMQTRMIDGYGTTTMTVGDAYWGYTTSGTAGLSFKSSGNRNVKAEVSYDFNFPEYDYTGTGYALPIITLDKAYVKARFPLFRLTAGKTRLGWGDGFVFNSGDVIFGSTSPYVDLTASEIRSETKWLTAVNVPLGRFSFIDILAVTPEADTISGKLLGDVEDISAGGRIYTKAGGLKIEAGYMLRGDEEESLHRPYLGFQGNLGADWYLAASAALPAEGNPTEEEFQDSFEESFNISFGLFHLQELTRVSSMTFRLESLIMPFMEWEEQTPADTAEIPDYALLLYPEIVYIPADTVSVSLRSIVSPLDSSAQITAGVGWNVFQGFSLLGYATFNAGEATDTFAFNRNDDIWRIGTDSIDGMAFSAGVSYIY